MYLNKHNIEICPSLEIGKDKDNNPLKIRIDKLTVVSCFIDESEREKTYSNLKVIREIKHKEYTTEHIKNKEGKPYRYALLIKGKDEYSPVLLRIDYSPINNKTGGIRLDFHPQHLTAKNLDSLLSWLNIQLGEVLYSLLKRAWVTQIDVALDLYDRSLDEYIWGLHRAGKVSYYNTPNGLPGIQIGSRRSEIHILAYEKIDVTKDIKIKERSKSKFIEVNINEYSRFLRIESRYRPNATSWKKNHQPLMLKNIKNLNNPFKRIQIYSVDLAHKLLSKGYIDHIPSEPSILILKKYIRQKIKSQRIPQEANEIIINSHVNLFDIDKVWEKWNICVYNLGKKLPF